MDGLMSPTGNPGIIAGLGANDNPVGGNQIQEDLIEVKVYFSGSDDQLHQKIMPKEK